MAKFRMSESEGVMAARAELAARKAKQQIAAGASVGAMVLRLSRSLRTNGDIDNSAAGAHDGYSSCSTWDLRVI